MVGQAPVICVMVPPIHLGAWSMLWLPFELLLLLLLGTRRARRGGSSTFSYNSLKRCWGSPGIGEDSVAA